MRRRRLIRIQLVLLGLLTAVLVARVVIGPASPDGLVVLAKLDAGEFYATSFRLDRTEPFFIDATGSLEDDFDSSRPVPALAAYAWILDRSTRHVVWKMDPTNVQVDRGTVANTSATLSLGPGGYDVFFTTLGNSRSSYRSGGFLSRLIGAHWTNDEDEWKFILQSASEVEPSTLAVIEETDTGWATGPEIVWATGPMTAYGKANYVFRIAEPVPLHVYSVGEICKREECDIGWIEEVFTATRVWELRNDNTSWAGGRAENRQFDDVVPLGEGLYRAVFKTDGGHDFGKWTTNPPFDPAGWGMTLSIESAGGMASVSDFDPWKTGEPVMRIRDVSNNEHHRIQFVVSEATPIIAHAAGELRSSGNLYDYGWIRNDDTDEKVWEMSWSASYPGGGHSGNREETAFLQLVPGKYSLYYQTDDSHAFESWSNGRPDHPERWGVAVFLFDPNSKLEIVEAKGPPGAPSVIPQATAPPVPLPPAGSGERIVDARQLGNEQNIVHEFTLSRATRLRIVAQGEISMSGRYDYGWIERSGSGETVWEMNYNNTLPAGGEDRNRRFDGYVELPAGSYVVRFATDFSHAFGDFGDTAPSDPGAWGIYVEKVRGD